MLRDYQNRTITQLYDWFRANGGRLSEVQKDWIAYLESIGHTVIIGHGWSDAMTKVQQLGKVPIK
jgi:hypothetical protein